MATRKRYDGMWTIGCMVSLALAPALGACEAPAKTDVVTARAEAIDRTTQRLGVGALLWANGTYGAGCAERSGSWSVRISGTDPMDYAPLSVIKNNAACALTLTQLVADQTYAADPSFVMSDSYQGSASEFASGVDLAFYANAKLSAATFSGDFVVTILYSDDASAANDAVTAGYASVSASSSATGVTSPDYTLDLTTDPFGVDVDVNDVVQSVSGKAILNDGTTTGEGYVIDLGTLGASPTFADLDAVYSAGTPVAIGGADPEIEASAFDLVGVDLSTAAVRTIVVRRNVSGVRSFQAFRITFNHP